MALLDTVTEGHGIFPEGFHFCSHLSPFLNFKKLVLFCCQAYFLNWWKIGLKAGLSASPEALRRKGSLAKVAAFKISI